ncbi:juvenile hormone esterase-like isoform X2 [Zophobas morio]|uniref:juvenile hormone esterase-like isoform X2 n=1 Tax=Zophobas morio TaxID=2755281 RepID=UPI003083C9D8
MLILTGFVLFAAVLGAGADSGPEVATLQGRLRGRVRFTRGNRTFGAFEGIAFARPPLGELRFKPPVPVEPWEGVKEVTQPHNICPQRDIYRRSTLIEGDEDCLYLNVYTPQVHDKVQSPLPVMVFFHGGGWLCGGGNSFWYGPDILLDRDVILVVTNYRLGALGFLSTGDEVVPGNNGMKDQNLAMKWVKENVHAFGGDPQKINIFGESAGGASVQLHMVSPLSRGLFSTAISQSGTAHCLWAVAPDGQALRHATMLAQEFGCSTESSSELVECLRKVPVYDLVAKDHIFMKWDTDPMIPFKPVVEPNLEGAFLVEHPIESMKEGRFAQVPWIVGLNTNDGALRAAGIFGNPHLIDELEEKFHEVVPVSLLYDEISPQVRLVTDRIRDFYFGGAKLNTSSRPDVVDMYTDGWFLNGADEAVQYYLKYSKKPIYYYLFGHRGPSSFTEIFGDKEKDYGVCHADELQYLFPLAESLFPDKPQTPQDKKIAEIMTTLWVNFALTGDPTPTTSDLVPSKWTPVTGDDLEYFHISSDGASMHKGLFKKRAEFWRNLPIRTSNEIKDEL